LNQVSQFAYQHGKTSNSRKMHKALYESLRAELGLPSQLTCSLFRQVGATYTGLWTKWRKNQEALKAGYTKKRFKGLDKPPRYVSPTLTYVEGRDYSFKTGNQVSILTLQGRLRVPYHGYSKHVAWIHDGAEIGSAKLWYDQRKKRFSLLVPLTLTLPNPEPTTLTQIVGVDVGQRYLATVTTTTNQTQFYSGKEARAKADHSARLQKRLQRKGTRYGPLPSCRTSCSTRHRWQAMPASRLMRTTPARCARAVGTPHERTAPKKAWCLSARSVTSPSTRT
jgi:hypothetical protein